MDKRNITCIVCPVGCSIEVSIDKGKEVGISGNSCKRGAEYARSECMNPVRTLTTTVKVINGQHDVVPVKSEKPLPRNLLFKYMEVIKGTRLYAPVEIGDVVVENILNTGVNIVATGSMLSSIH